MVTWQVKCLCLSVKKTWVGKLKKEKINKKTTIKFSVAKCKQFFYDETKCNRNRMKNINKIKLNKALLFTHKFLYNLIVLSFAHMHQLNINLLLLIHKLAFHAQLSLYKTLASAHALKTFIKAQQLKL